MTSANAGAAPEKVAIVIGGTSGIGLATARLLIEGGARVTIAGRNAERGARARQGLGERAHYACMDVASAGQVAAMYRALIPMARIGDPVECACAITWLLSDAASYVTGAVLTVDGGMALRAA